MRGATLARFSSPIAIQSLNSGAFAPWHPPHFAATIGPTSLLHVTSCAPAAVAQHAIAAAIASLVPSIACLPCVGRVAYVRRRAALTLDRDQPAKSLRRTVAR